MQNTVVKTIIAMTDNINNISAFFVAVFKIDTAKTAIINAKINDICQIELLDLWQQFYNLDTAQLLSLLYN